MRRQKEVISISHYVMQSLLSIMDSRLIYINKSLLKNVASHCLMTLLLTHTLSRKMQKIRILQQTIPDPREAPIFIEFEVTEGIEMAQRYFPDANKAFYFIRRNLARISRDQASEVLAISRYKINRFENGLA